MVLKNSKKITVNCRLGMLMLLLFCGCDMSNNSRYISGKVIDSSTGKPLREVMVQVGYTFGVTGDEGAFLIENPPLGVQPISAHKSGYHTYSGTVKIIKVASIYHTMEMTVVDTAPVPPTKVVAVASDSRVAVSWESVSGAQAYTIYWDISSGVTKETGIKISDVTSPYLHPELTNDLSYYYIVTAENTYGESDASPEVSATPSACPVTLDEWTLDYLTIDFPFGPLEMKPGEGCSFTLGVPECCYFFNPVDACAVWSVTPSEGASINPLTGAFAVDSLTPHGTVFTICANVEEGRRLLTRDVYIYTPESNPLVGLWREYLQLSCVANLPVVPEEPINEIIFFANGEFFVTWLPFEIYVDYWGTYTYDLDSHTLNLNVENGNYIPDDIDGNGLFFINDNGQLILSDVWLGSPSDRKCTGACGHLLSRD
jgi:hypothetical protein